MELSLTRAEQWTLHHVLLDRIEREFTAGDATGIDPLQLDVYAVFDTLEAGETRFTVAQLEASLAVLSRYHHQPGWCADRDRLEGLLWKFSRTLERHRHQLDYGTADD